MSEQRITNSILNEATKTMTLDKASEAFGVSRSTLSKYKNVKYNMNPTAEVWLRGLLKLGLAKISKGKIIIKTGVV